jgi:hypothetical protein
MTTQTSTRSHTGQRCEISGVYSFDGYLDGSSYPPPTAQEQREPIARHNIFPPIRSSGKGCYWKLIERA